MTEYRLKLDGLVADPEGTLLPRLRKLLGEYAVPAAEGDLDINLIPTSTDLLKLGLDPRVVKALAKKGIRHRDHFRDRTESEVLGDGIGWAGYQTLIKLLFGAGIKLKGAPADHDMLERLGFSAIVYERLRAGRFHPGRRHGRTHPFATVSQLAEELDYVDARKLFGNLSDQKPYTADDLHRELAERGFSFAPLREDRRIQDFFTPAMWEDHAEMGLDPHLKISELTREHLAGAAETNIKLHYYINLLLSRLRCAGVDLGPDFL